MKKTIEFASAMALAVLCSASLPAGADDDRELEPVPKWQDITGLPGEEKGPGFKKLAKSFSGLGCGPATAGELHCVLAPDERTSVYFLTLKDGAVALGRQLPLLEVPGVPVNDPQSKVEGDFEAVARDGNTYWVFGSHSTRRDEVDEKKCYPEALRRHVFRFDVDATTGLPAAAFDADHIPAFVRHYDGLPKILSEVPDLAKVVDANICADAGGFNIEGATVGGGVVTLGLRAPLGAAGEALAVTFSVARLEGAAGEAPVLHRLKLDGFGIRDLTAVPGGHLVLAGPPTSDDDDDKRPQSTLWYWKSGGDDVTLIGSLAGTKKKTKPEALAVLAVDAAEWRVLVVGDGVRGGNPVEYRFPDPRR